MRQLKIFSSQSPKQKTKWRREHGGSIGIGRRRRRRPMDVKAPLHLVLRSDFAFGRRSLLRHRPLIERVLRKAQGRFKIRVYEKAIVSNHIHLIVKGKDRESLQNFFRVFAGHIAQEILKEFPILQWEKKMAGGAPREKANKFWETRIYSRIVTWGREFRAVKRYVFRNLLEASGLIAYKPRKKIKNTT